MRIEGLIVIETRGRGEVSVKEARDIKKELSSAMDKLAGNFEELFYETGLHEDTMVTTSVEILR